MTSLPKHKPIHIHSFIYYTSLMLLNFYSLDMDSGRVTFGEQVLSLTATEYNLLELLRRNPDRIFSLRVILDRLWGMDGFVV